jgi:hypothetical protein
MHENALQLIPRRWNQHLRTDFQATNEWLAYLETKPAYFNTLYV